VDHRALRRRPAGPDRLGILGALGMSFVRFSTLSFQSFSEVVFHFTPTPQIIDHLPGLRFADGASRRVPPAIRASRVSPAAAMRD